MKPSTIGTISNKMKIAARLNVKEKHYWLNQLSGHLVKSFFPYDRKETAKDERRLHTVNFQFSGELFSRLMRLSNNSDNRLHMVLAAGLVTLLNKYAGNKDIIVGMPIYKQQMEGEFINTVLPLRNKLEPGMTFKQLLLQVKQTIFEAVEHQNYPMETLLYKLNIPSSQKGTGFALFDAAILLENIHDKRYLKHINYNMLFSIIRTGNALEGTLEYNSSLYEKTTAQRITAHFQHLFDTVFSHLDAPLEDIDILPAEEKRQILFDFNHTGAAYPQDKTIHALLEARVGKKPDKTAVVYRHQYLTYRALNEKANQLAGLLREKGVRQESIVAIIMEPSPELVIGITGILKAGGAYLPIDPQYPERRIISILRDSGASILLTKEKIINAITLQEKTPDPLKVLLLDQIGKNLGRYSGANPDHINQPGDLLYLISTSGSTGVPKSIMMEHRNLANLLNFQFFDTGVDFKRVLQFASIGFDVSSQEIFSTLLAGGELYLVDNETKRDVYRLFELMRKNHLNVVYWPPAFLKYVFSEADPRARFPKSVEHIITAGEQLVITGPIRRYMKENHVYVHNHYGPAETHVVTTFVIDPGGDIPELPPIGKPIANTRIYILDENKKVKPIGTFGELYIAGANVGRGYHRKKELTAEKYIPDPFVKGERMYRTGDLARWFPDGSIEFIGRADYQVKIRGFRIELGEIETRLMEIPVVKEAVVVDYKDPAGEKFLCAYIVTKKDVQTSEIKHILSIDLPDYMIPMYFVPLEKIPVTPNGKVDKKALPMPKLEKSETYTAPRDEVEMELALIWSEVLGLDKTTISIDANFFDLGGHSLKATILITRIHKAFNVKVTLGEMFAEPFIRGLGQLIKEAGGDIFSAVQPEEKKEYYPLSSAQKRIYILQRMIKDNISYNNPAAVVLEGELHKERFEETLQQLINRHETLRTSFEMKAGQAVQEVHADVTFVLEYNEIAEEEVEKRILRFIRPFDLSRAPLMRVGLIKTGEKQHIVMYDLHHTITDGTSMQVFIREFLALYAGNPLPPLKVQYKDFSGWQNRLFESGEMRKQQEYWLEQFEGEIPVLNIPTDFPRPEIQRFEGNVVNFEIGSETTRALNQLAKEQNATLYMVLLAVYNVLLSKLSGQEDIIIGNSIAGRRHADLHFIIGMFVNTIVMRNYPAGQKSFKEFLDELKERTLAAFENQDYPFEELVDQIAVNRDTGRNPLFDVMFVLQNMAVQSGTIPEARIPGLKTTPYQPKTQPALNVSKFDITLVTIESGDRLLFIYEYSTALFKRETIERFITYFKRIVEDISRQAEKKIADIEMISPEEKNRLLKEFNQTGFDYPGDKTIHELFIEQAQTTPDHIAVVGAQGTVPLPGDHVSITYNELNEKSDRLAHHLRSRGVGPDTIAAIMVERSIELIIGILGILKAGGAYLPIDPGSPREHIDYMLNDSKALLLLTSEELADVGKGTKFCAPTTRNPHLSLAYVIYTSGTTGRPKGVLIHHRGVVNMVWFHRHVFKENPRSRISQVASAVFDAMAFEIWPCLLGGAALYIIDNETRMHPQRLKEWITGRQITISFQPTRMAQELLEEQWPETGAALEVLRTAGERLTCYPSRRYPFRFYNLYGPTEDTVWSTWIEIPMVNTAEKLNPPPIGKPAANKQVFILSTDLKLQPVGVVGELCLSGDGLARGYLNNPELTAEKFVLASYRSYRTYNSKKIYKTGDLARWLSDGNIEFIGRIDQQVKIRGFRIEPGEIQNRLLAYDLVKSSVVIAIEEGGETYLCAYIVTKETFDLSGLKDFLSASLPEYMIPAYFVEIDKIPLTPGGKVDRKALPQPEVKSGEAYAAPGDDVEEQLAGIWSEVLGVEKEKIGINDDFFRIGGHSLKAAAIISGIQKEFAVDVPLIEIFRIPTIKQLARHIREDETKSFLVRDENLTLLRKQDPDAKHLFLVHDGSGEVEGYIEFCRYLNNGFNCWGIRADRNENYGPKNLNIREIAGKYIEKIKALQPAGPYFIAGWSLGGTIAFEMVNQLEQGGEGMGFFALIDSPSPRQANSQRDMQRFTLETEEQFVTRYLSQRESEKIRESAAGMDDFWAHIVDYLEAEQFNVQLIRQVVREYEAHVVPNYQGLGIGQLVRYLNTGRTWQNARAMYTPSGKIYTPVHYFAARQSEGIIIKDDWNEHCREPIKIYEISGDHYSIFAGPDVLYFAEFFGNVLMN